MKTLKDLSLKFEVGKEGDATKYDAQVELKEILKQEGINWIKLICKENELIPKRIAFSAGDTGCSLAYGLGIVGLDDVKLNESQQMALATISWIMQFFNLETEDIK